MSTRDGNPEIYVMAADGSGQVNRTSNAAADGRPSWSRNGRQITFMSMRDGNMEVYTMNADGTLPTRLTNDPAIDDFPYIK